MRKYENNAARQRAYRLRKKQKQELQPVEKETVSIYVFYGRNWQMWMCRNCRWVMTGFGKKVCDKCGCDDREPVEVSIPYDIEEVRQKRQEWFSQHPNGIVEKYKGDDKQ